MYGIVTLPVRTTIPFSTVALMSSKIVNRDIAVHRTADVVGEPDVAPILRERRDGEVASSAAVQTRE